jgi:hypothetical protein
MFFFHGFISFLKYTYQWNTNLTWCGLENPSTDGTFVCRKRKRFWSRPSVFKGQGMCISYSDLAWSWFVSRQKQGICPPYTASRPSLDPQSLQFIVYGSSYSGYGGLKINPLHISNVEVNNEWNCASSLPKCLPVVQGEDPSHLLLFPQYSLLNRLNLHLFHLRLLCKPVGLTFGTRSSRRHDSVHQWFLTPKNSLYSRFPKGRKWNPGWKVPHSHTQNCRGTIDGPRVFCYVLSKRLRGV